MANLTLNNPQHSTKTVGRFLTAKMQGECRAMSTSPLGFAICVQRKTADDPTSWTPAHRGASVLDGLRSEFGIGVREEKG